MTIERRSVLSGLLLFAILFSSVSFSFARMDEGMFMPDKIAGIGNLKKRGLKIKPEEIYNPNGGGLTDAVIRLSIGCTAEFVSPDGLILTNHHCGFDALVSASTPTNDLVENGFKADNRAGEIHAKDYSIFITERVEDVTAKIAAGGVKPTGEALAAAVKALTDAEQAKAPKGSVIRIQVMNNGFFVYLFQTRQIKDVRVVYAPPRNIGVFGGDPDNFEWTRHTGDFTFLRAYTAPDGSSAEYSPNNVPYKAKKFLKMNIGGLKEDDFVFILGYPGGTTRYRESQSIEYARDANYPFLAAWLKARIAALRLIGESDENKRIALQSDIASFDNGRKLYEGRMTRLRLADVVAKRRAEEARFSTWVAANPERQKKYGTVLSELASVSAESNKAAKLDILVRRMPDPTMPMFGQIYTAIAAGKMLSDSERAAKLAEIKKALEEREPVYERELIKFYLRKFDELPANQKFEAAEKLFGTFQGSARRAAEAAFAENIAEGSYWNAESVAALYGPQAMDFRPERDNVKGFAAALKKAKDEANARAAVFASKIDRLRLLYMQGLAEMNGVTPYPDANSTLRFTYGNVKGYSPREAEFMTPFTTLKGMFEKDTGENPFDVPQKLRDLQAARDFGRYGQGDSVIVNFLSTVDIIGGNSGSPVLNGSGEQVGLAFDSNYEGTGGDFYYEPNVNRTIAVDIRFVLFVTEKFGGAKWIVDEMSLVGGPKAKRASN
ncbi:MAG: S46 family peptidase [Pyrinomonadaceae bacterium]|nr:S46 family peptidase [Blastocatellia bacterium]MCW5955787.1 S46 family peptidase [Pyrinomonadaceae bacterium]